MKDTNTSAQRIALAQINPQSAGGAPVLQQMAALHGVKVMLTVSLGQVETSLGELMDLKPASVLKVGRDVDSMVDVLVDGNVVARGYLVAVGDNFGVCIAETAAAH